MDLLNSYASDSDIDSDHNGIYNLARHEPNMVSPGQLMNDTDTEDDPTHMEYEDIQDYSNNTSKNSASIDVNKIVPVVTIHIQPINPQLIIDQNIIVNLQIIVITRYVPHLGTHLDLMDSVMKQNGMIDLTDSDNDSDSDAGSIELTGDIDTDRQQLLELMGQSDMDGSDSDSASDMDMNELVHDSADDESLGIDPVYGIRSKNELSLNELSLTNELIEYDVNNITITYCGTVMSTVSGLLVVQSAPHTRALSIGSVLCYGNKHVIGQIEELIGSVQLPFYTVRFAKNHILQYTDNNNHISINTPVYSINELSSYALADHIPGSDASNVNDEEIELDEQEYSDDEQEAAAKKAKKQNKKRNNQQAQSSEYTLPSTQHTVPIQQPYYPSQYIPQQQQHQSSYINRFNPYHQQQQYIPKPPGL